MAKLLYVIAFLVAVVAVRGQPAPAPQPDCSSVVFDMSDCLGYVSAGSTDAEPPATCCSGVGSVVKVSPKCLCAALDLSSEMGIAVDMTRAMALPGVCGVQIPDHNCNNVAFTPSSAPADSPQWSPAPLEPTPPSAGSTPSASPVTPVTPEPSADTPTPPSAEAQSPSASEASILASSIAAIVSSTLLAIAFN